VPLHDRERRLRQGDDDFDERPAGARRSGGAPSRENGEKSGGKEKQTEDWAAQKTRMVRAIPPGYRPRPG
jgi:hypothetical protein